MDFDIDQKELIIKRSYSKLPIEELLDIIKKSSGKTGFVQIFDPLSIINRTQLIGSYINALITFKNGTNKTSSAGMEMLLFAAMTDQIGRAISVAGAKTSSDFVIFSDKASIFNKIKPFLSSETEFKPDAAHMKRAAKALGMNIDGRNADEVILERLTMSRLGPG
jgi:tRNA threonylcarbamoyladenosine modification (KEOPS) complex Cgi121 subunit